MKDDGMIHVPARKKKPVEESQVIRISAQAYNSLIDIYNESTVTMSGLVSRIILQSVDRVVLDKED